MSSFPSSLLNTFLASATRHTYTWSPQRVASAHWWKWSCRVSWLRIDLFWSQFHMICFLAILRRESICLRVHVVSSTMAFEESTSRTLVCKLVVLRCQSSCHAHTVTCAHAIHATCAIRPIGLTIHSSDQWVGSTLHHGCCFCCWRWWSTARWWRCRLDRGQLDVVISSNVSRTKSADYLI